MRRSVAVLSIFLTCAGSNMAVARPEPHATPTVHATSKHVPVSNGLRVGGKAHQSPSPMSGSGCGRAAAGTGINPATGKPYPAPIVEIPLGRDADTLQNATTRAQQKRACAHPTH